MECVTTDLRMHLAVARDRDGVGDNFPARAPGTGFSAVQRQTCVLAGLIPPHQRRPARGPVRFCSFRLLQKKSGFRKRGLHKKKKPCPDAVLLTPSTLPATTMTLGLCDGLLAVEAGRRSLWDVTTSAVTTRSDKMELFI